MPMELIKDKANLEKLSPPKTEFTHVDPQRLGHWREALFLARYFKLQAENAELKVKILELEMRAAYRLTLEDAIHSETGEIRRKEE